MRNIHIIKYKDISNDFIAIQHLRARGRITKSLQKETAQAQVLRAGLLTFSKETTFLSNNWCYWPITTTN